MLIGMLSNTLFSPNLIAQKQTGVFSEVLCSKLIVGEIACRKLRVVDGDGNDYVVLSSDILNGMVQVMLAGRPLVSLGGLNPDGGSIDVFNRTGEKKINLSAFGRDWGRINVYGKDGRFGTAMLTNKILLYGKDGGLDVGLIAYDEGESEVQIWGGGQGQLHKVVLSTDETGGYVTVSGNDGGAVLSTDQKGGRVRLLRNDGTEKVISP